MKVELSADILSNIQNNTSSKMKTDDLFDLMLDETLSVDSVKQSGSLGLMNSIYEINNTQLNANSLVQDVISGNSDNTHGALIALEKADLQMQLAVTTRDKLIQGYQSIINMQI